jgi:hypothetical protein
MDELEKSLVEEIKKLHSEVISHLKMTIPQAIRIGELLGQQKGRLGHGAFGKWIEENLPFTDRTARNYMRLYNEKDRLLKTETVSDLKSAYNLLTDHKEKNLIEEMKHIISLQEKSILLYDEGRCDSYFSEIENQIHHLLGELKTSFKKELDKIQDIEQAVRVHDLAKRNARLAGERVLHCERRLGECLNELEKQGVPKWVWTTKGGFERFVKICDCRDHQMRS